MVMQRGCALGSLVYQKQKQLFSVIFDKKHGAGAQADFQRQVGSPLVMNGAR